MVKRKDNLELGWAGDLHLPHREWPSVVWKALKQVAHDDPEHSSSRGAIEEMTSTKLVLSSRASFPAPCTCAFLTTLIALLFISPSSGNLCQAGGQGGAWPIRAIEGEEIVEGATC